jgi:hypothetical protein
MKKKEKNLIKGKRCQKKENKGGEKTDSSNDETVFVKEKTVQKTDSSKDDFEEKNWLMEMRMSTLKK